MQEEDSPHQTPIHSLSEPMLSVATISPTVLLTSSMTGVVLHSPSESTFFLHTPPSSPSTRHGGLRNHTQRLIGLTRSDGLGRTPLRRSASPGEQPQQQLLSTTSSTPSSCSLSSSPTNSNENLYEELKRHYVIQEMFFSIASSDAKLPNGFECLDINHELFGLGKCRDLILDRACDATSSLSMAFANTPAAPPIFFNPLVRKKQAVYLFAPPGFGLRTLVVNLCRERHINLLYVGNPVLCTENYIAGTYSTIVRRAAAMQPCIVLIDRLSEHWNDHYFGRVGYELFAFWAHAGYDICTPPLRVWFVLTGSEPIQKLSPIFQQQIGPNGFAFVDPIDREQTTYILRRAYADCIRACGIVDDRPPPSLDDPVASIRYQERFLHERSKFQQLLNAKQPYLEHLAARIFESTQRQEHAYILPATLHVFMAMAFRCSCERFAAFWQQQQQQSGMRIECTSEAILPIENDFETALKLTYPMAE